MSSSTISGVSATPIAKPRRKVQIANLIQDLMGGQYNNPVRIVCFNTAQGTSRNATLEIAQEIQDRVSRNGEEISPGLHDFIEWELERSKRLLQNTSAHA